MAPSIDAPRRINRLDKDAKNLTKTNSNVQVVKIVDKMNVNQYNDIMVAVQKDSACHQKFLQITEKIYNSTVFEEFFKVFMDKIKLVFQNLNEGNPYIQRFLDFNAQFVALITRKTVNEDSIINDESSHPFLTDVINETLKFHNLIQVQARYNSCKFITLILKHIGYKIQLDNDVCDKIQACMLERICDSKSLIQIQAITALVRLQEPTNPDCPIIKAYLSCFNDNIASVRREVVARIAPTAVTITKVKGRVRDVDSSVRIAALKRCADIGPKLFKIVDRQSILASGFSETVKHVRKVFIETLLPKWLTHYDRDYLKFIQGLKLDADEEDIKTTFKLTQQVMEVFFRQDPIGDIINALPMKGQLIPVHELGSDNVMYWSILTNYLRDMEDEGEDYLERILPELTPFCHYIDSFIKTRTSKPMDEWENMDYQFVFNILVEMAEKYDFSDEVGRRTLKDLLWRTLQNFRLQSHIVNKIISILERLSSNLLGFVNEMCNFISEIREPLVEEAPTQEKLREKEFQLAQLKVKLNVLEGDKEDALDKQEYNRLEDISKQLKEAQATYQSLMDTNDCEMVRVVKEDTETLCHCLDLLIGILLLPSIKNVYPALRTVYTEFVNPLLTNNSIEVNWRVLNCLGLYSFIDLGIAKENVKILCIPVVTYRAIPNYNKNALIVSIKSITDLLRVYGTGLFEEEDGNNTMTDKNQTRRRLYRNEDMHDIVTIVNNDRLSVEYLIELILDMLDDENGDIRDTAMCSLYKMILFEFPINPGIISRLILKWYTPLTDKSDVFQQKLGILIDSYSKMVKGAREIIGKAIIPILMSICNAPKSSPLADIDIDNMLRFLTILTTGETTDIVNTHVSLGHSLCAHIISQPQHKCVTYMARMLLHLNLPNDNLTAIKELIRQSELIHEEVQDKAPKKNIFKFIQKLNSLQSAIENGPPEGESMATIVEESRNESENKENDSQVENSNNKRKNSEQLNEVVNKKTKIGENAEENNTVVLPNTRFLHKKRPVIFNVKKKGEITLKPGYTPKVAEDGEQVGLKDAQERDNTKEDDQVVNNNVIVTSKKQTDAISISSEKNQDSNGESLNRCRNRGRPQKANDSLLEASKENGKIVDNKMSPRNRGRPSKSPTKITSPTADDSKKSSKDETNISRGRPSMSPTKITSSSSDESKKSSSDVTSKSRGRPSKSPTKVTSQSSDESKKTSKEESSRRSGRPSKSPSKITSPSSEEGKKSPRVDTSRSRGRPCKSPTKQISPSLSKENNKVVNEKRSPRSRGRPPKSPMKITSPSSEESKKSSSMNRKVNESQDLPNNRRSKRVPSKSKDSSMEATSPVPRSRGRPVKSPTKMTSSSSDNSKKSFRTYAMKKNKKRRSKSTMSTSSSSDRGNKSKIILKPKAISSGDGKTPTIDDTNEIDENKKNPKSQAKQIISACSNEDNISPLKSKNSKRLLNSGKESREARSTESRKDGNNGKGDIGVAKENNELSDRLQTPNSVSRPSKKKKEGQIEGKSKDEVRSPRNKQESSDDSNRLKTRKKVVISLFQKRSKSFNANLSSASNSSRDSCITRKSFSLLNIKPNSASSSTSIASSSSFTPLAKKQKTSSSDSNILTRSVGRLAKKNLRNSPLVSVSSSGSIGSSRLLRSVTTSTPISINSDTSKQSSKKQKILVRLDRRDLSKISERTSRSNSIGSSTTTPRKSISRQAEFANEMLTPEKQVKRKKRRGNSDLPNATNIDADRKSNRVVHTDTSSDELSPIRKSSRKIKKKKNSDFV